MVGWVESTPLLHGVKCCVMAPKTRSSVKEAALELIRAWGREGGKKGAKARWEHVTPEERSKLAKKAAAARWSKPRAAR